jgi:ribosomal protein S27E
MFPHLHARASCESLTSRGRTRGLFESTPVTAGSAPRFYMAALSVTCEKCGSQAIVLKFKGMMPLKADDPPAHVLLTIRCPNCAERQQVRTPNRADGGAAIRKREYLSH